MVSHQESLCFSCRECVNSNDIAVDKHIEKEEVAVEDIVEPESEPEEVTLTFEQKQAIKKAKSYLDFSAFSKQGLVGQLEFEGFATEDAQFAVDNMEVDWKEQALKKGKDYLDFSSFSKSGLYDQLIFEKFTAEEAQYAIDNIE